MGTQTEPRLLRDIPITLSGRTARLLYVDTGEPEHTFVLYRGLSAVASKAIEGVRATMRDELEELRLTLAEWVKKAHAETEILSRRYASGKTFQEHVDGWLAANQKTGDEVLYGAFPLGMVGRWIERATHAEKELDDMRVDWDRKSDELREAHEQTARMVQQLQDVLGGGHTAVYDLANDIRDLIDQWGEPWHRETTWLVERGQPEGLLRAEWLKAGCGWTAEWTQDALLAQRFPFKAIAVDSIQHYGLKARPVLHGFLAPESSQPATPEGSHDA